MRKIATVISAMVLAMLTGCAASGGGFVGTGAMDADNEFMNHTAAWSHQVMTID